MAALPIRYLGDPVLRRRAKPVAQITAVERQLIANMIDTLAAHEGVGLAAPQVGVAKRIIVARATESGLVSLINPEIVHRSAETAFGVEGCLSIPGFQGEVERHVAITLKGLTPEGQTLQLNVNYFPARVVQHEIDHLDGKLFIDRALPESLRSVEYEENPETGEEEAILTPVTLEEIRRFFAQKMHAIA